MASGCVTRRRQWRARIGVLVGILPLISSLPSNAAGAPTTAASTTAAMRILKENCFACHNEEKHKAGLNLTSRTGLLHGGDEGAVIDSQHPGESRLIRALSPDADPHMPPKGQLTAEQISELSQWMGDGVSWDAAELARLRGPREIVWESLPRGYGPVEAITIAPDGARMAFGRGNHLVVHGITETNAPVLRDFQAHRDVIRAVAWSRDGRWLASGGTRELVVWNAATFEPAWRLGSNLVGRVTALRFTPHGGALIVADGLPAESGWVRVLRAETGDELAGWQAHSDTIEDLAVSDDGGLVATAGADKLIKTWELITRREVTRIEGHLGAVTGIGFNPGSTRLVSVSADRQLRLSDLRTGEALVTVAGRKQPFNAVAWSADGARVAAADAGGNLVSFTEFKPHTGAQSSDTATERNLGHWKAPLNAVAVSSDGGIVVTGGEDGVVYVVHGDGRLVATVSPGANESQTPEMAGASTADATGTEPPPSFVHDILPALAKAGCAAGSCHAKPEGQNGFQLSVFSHDPSADYAEIVKESRGRRVFPAAPDESLLILKPTAAIDHGGGRRFERDSELHQLLRRWVRTGMTYQNPGEASLAGIDVEPREGIYSKGDTRALRVTARYDDGTARDVSRFAEFVSNEKEVVEVGEDGRMKTGTLGGEAVVVARFMGFVAASRVTVPAERSLPAESYAALPVYNFIDRLAKDQFRKLGIFPSDVCTDEEFVRRAHLDVIGRLPTPGETRAFLVAASENSRGARASLVDRLLGRPEYADYWANKWADLLRPNPDRVGVKSVYILDQWLRDAFRSGKPYDQFVREILLAEGNNHRDGPIVIYRDRRDPPELTTLFSQLFLGVRMECAKCHHHPNEKWSQDDFYQFAAIFGALKQKGAGLSPPISAGTETFYSGDGGSVKHPVSGQVMKPGAPDGPLWDDSDDPRRHLVNWMTTPGNPFFARAAVNRVWASFFGRGFVEPVDDFRISNPASDEPLLEALAHDFEEHGYDLKHLMRTITASRLYQLSATPNEFNLGDTRNFSRSYRRRLPAEVLLDAVDEVVGVDDEFNGCPPGTRAVQTWSYKVSSHFMDAFGRPNPSTDCPCERDVRPSVVQALHLMNSDELQRKLASDSGRVQELVSSDLAPAAIVRELYLSALSRQPAKNELETACASYEAAGATRRTATEDVLWALLNSAEFVFNH